MVLTKGIIRADLIAAKQAIDYFDEKGIRDAAEHFMMTRSILHHTGLLR